MTSSIADRDSARLAWAPDQPGTPPSGVWWPRSRDAAVELNALLPLVGEHVGGPVTRVSLNIGAWDADQPRRLRVDDRIVRVGWFHTLDAATVTLARGSDARTTLHVVAPELDPAAARELLHEVSTSSS